MPRTNPASEFGLNTLEGTLAFAVGIIAGPAGLSAPIFALLLAGAGHGWCTPIQVCWIAFATSPLVVLSWGFRRRWWGQALALLLIAVFAAADFLLVTWTQGELEYLNLVWERGGGMVMMMWFAVWLYPQVVVVAALTGAVFRVWRGRLLARGDSDEPCPGSAEV
jgi:hypothetical protein